MGVWEGKGVIFLWDDADAFHGKKDTVVICGNQHILLSDLTEALARIKGKGKSVILKRDTTYAASFRIVDKKLGWLIVATKRKEEALEICRRNEWNVEDLTGRKKI